MKGDTLHIGGREIAMHFNNVIEGGKEVVGYCFTPQDGNALLSSLAATLWYLHPDGFDDRIDVIRPYLFREV